MVKKWRGQKGFTLIEMLIAMSIFVIFVGILINSYSSIVKDQREANNYRVLYSEARRVFDKLTGEIRDNAIYYPANVNLNPEYNNPRDELVLVSKDGEGKVYFEHKDGEVVFTGEGGAVDSYSLISEESGVRIIDFNVFVSPAGDPYRDENIYADSLQFQPKVTVFARFEKDKLKGGDPYVIDLQTTVSSRFYTVSPAGDLTY